MMDIKNNHNNITEIVSLLADGLVRSCRSYRGIGTNCSTVS